jgi:hypothetical protein
MTTPASLSVQDKATLRATSQRYYYPAVENYCGLLAAAKKDLSKKSMRAAKN